MLLTYPALPAGSQIILETSLDGAAIVRLPKAHSGIMERWFPAAFLTFWLCGWAVGEFFVIKTLFFGKDLGYARLFLLAWLGGWTVGGFFAMRQWYLLIRGPQEPRLIFRDSTLELLNASGGKKREVIDRKSAASARLDWPNGRQRLIIDEGVRRLEIGEALSEPEREWLCERITQWSAAGHG